MNIKNLYNNFQYKVIDVEVLYIFNDDIFFLVLNLNQRNCQENGNFNIE